MGRVYNARGVREYPIGTKAEACSHAHVPAVSIVMPTFNRLELLPSTVQSVFHQTVHEWELIVADDGSDEDVLAYLEALQEDERVQLLRLDHSGNPGAARNAGIAAARAPFVAFLDSDDLWAPNMLERQLALLRANPQCGWSYTAFVIVDAGGVPLASESNRPWTPHCGHIFVQTVRTTASIRVSAVLVRTQLLREVGTFDEQLDCSEDYDLWMRLALRSSVCVVDEPLARIRRHAANGKRAVGYAHVARDYSLRKLSEELAGKEHALLADERIRNMLALAATRAAHGSRWGAVAAIGRSVPLGWKCPRWWLRGAKVLLRAYLPLRVTLRSV